MHIAKRRKGNHEQNKEEQVITESSLTKLVGAADVYNLEEKDPPSTLMCDLRPYQKQALYWMSELEKGVDVEQAAKTLHPCWAAYHLSDKRASAVYVNVFSGEATTIFPSAIQMARGGILADAMGLGKTVMTIALILGNLGRGNSGDLRVTANSDDDNDDGKKAKRKDPQVESRPTVKGGTLIICPMALLGQWKITYPTVFLNGDLFGLHEVVGTVEGGPAPTKIKTDLKKPIVNRACHPRLPILYVAYAEGLIRAYNIQTYAVHYTLQLDNTIRLIGAGVFSFHPTLKWIFLGDRKGTRLAWDVSAERPNMIGM